MLARWAKIEAKRSSHVVLHYFTLLLIGASHNEAQKSTPHAATAKQKPRSPQASEIRKIVCREFPAVTSRPTTKTHLRITDDNNR